MLLQKARHVIRVRERVGRQLLSTPEVLKFSQQHSRAGDVRVVPGQGC